MKSLDYEDIINLERPDNGKHAHLSKEQRAAQFAPFSALSGLKKVIDLANEEHIKEVEEANAPVSYKDLQ